MAAVSSPPFVPPALSSVIQPTHNDSSCSRTTKIALAIFVSLAGFVFLSFGMAITLSAVVTIGAILGCPEDKNPSVPSTLASDVAPQPIVLDKWLYPTRIEIPDESEPDCPADRLSVTFQTPEARQKFGADYYTAHFQTTAFFSHIKTQPLVTVIRLKDRAMDEGKKITSIVNELKNLFGQNMVEKIIVHDVDCVK